MPSPVVHFEVAVRDVKKGADFYGGLFGWKFHVDPKFNYHMVNAEENGGGIGGGLFQTEEGKFPPYVTIYVQVDDLSAALDRAVELGGRRIMEPMDIGDEGAVAMFADPDGNVVGLFSSK